jgi:OOP family OmpA-OmpF porin
MTSLGGNPMTIRFLIMALAAALLCPMMAQADMYVGASIGNTWQSATPDDKEIADELGDISENSTGWKIFGGFQNEGIFGVEGGYRDLGEIESSGGDYKFKTSSKGWDIQALGHLKLSLVDLFAKAGVFFWKTDAAFKDLSTEASETSADASGTDFIWGLGAGISLGAIGVRLEWESMEASGMDNLSMLSLGATLGF